MSIKVICPSCNTEAVVPNEAAGKRGKCRKCGGEVRVPDVASSKSLAQASSMLTCSDCGGQFEYVNIVQVGNSVLCRQCVAKTKVPTPAKSAAGQQPVRSGGRTLAFLSLFVLVALALGAWMLLGKKGWESDLAMNASVTYNGKVIPMRNAWVNIYRTSVSSRADRQKYFDAALRCLEDKERFALEDVDKSTIDSREYDKAQLAKVRNKLVRVRDAKSKDQVLVADAISDGMHGDLGDPNSKFHEFVQSAKLTQLRTDNDGNLLVPKGLLPGGESVVIFVQPFDNDGLPVNGSTRYGWLLTVSPDSSRSPLGLDMKNVIDWR